MTDKIRVGFEGNFEVKEISVAAGDPVPWDPSQEFTIVGTRVPRLDGKAKTTGTARYSIDVRLPGMLYGRILRCPLAAATVTSVDVAEAKKMPGVKAVLVIAEKGDKIRFAGQEIAAVAAETPEQAADALGAVRVAYAPRAFVVGIEASRKDGAPLVFEGQADTKTSGGDVESKAKGLPRKGNVVGPRATNKATSRRDSARPTRSSNPPTSPRFRPTRPSRRTASSPSGTATTSRSGARPRAFSTCATSSPRV